MKRKDFLGSVFSAAASFPLLASAEEKPDDKGKHIIIPPYLKPGDVIGITSPAGNITLEEIQPAVQQIESWGFKTKAGDTIGKKDFTFGGTDQERWADFQHMLDDTSISAILCARG